MTTMRAHYMTALVVLATVFAAGIGRTVVTAQAKKTVWTGIYTAEQSAKGKTLANENCAPCHGADIKGGDLAPTLSGNDFIGHWYDAKLSELADKVALTMPANAPGSLKSDEYAAVLAYMLEVNGVPAGMETLQMDKPTLDSIMIVKKP